MAAKRNQYKEEEKTKTKKTREKKTTGFFFKVKSFFADERLHKTFGLLCILFGLFAFVAIISYLFTWKNDASIIDGKSFGFIFDSEEEVANWLGKFGAITAHQFLKIWFGLSSVFIPFYLIILGVRVLFKIKLLPLFKTIKIGFVSMVWFSMFFALLFDVPYDFMGGLFGEQIILWTKGAFGMVGSVFFVLFTGFIGVVVLFNPSFDWIKERFESKSIEVEDETESIPVTNSVLKTNKSKKM